VSDDKTEKKTAIGQLYFCEEIKRYGIPVQQLMFPVIYEETQV